MAYFTDVFEVIHSVKSRLGIIALSARMMKNFKENFYFTCRSPLASEATLRGSAYNFTCTVRKGSLLTIFQK